MKPEDRLSRLRLDDRWADAEFWRLDVRTEVASKPRRPLMRYGVAAAVLAIVATATATVFAQRWTGAHHRSSTSLAVASEPGIAWKALPPRADDAPEPPTCNANTLSSAAAPPGEVMGALHLKIHVTNNGAACVLAGLTGVPRCRRQRSGSKSRSGQRAADARCRRDHGLLRRLRRRVWN